MKLQVSLIAPALVFLILGLAVGSSKRNDNEITSEIQQRINADSGLRNKQIAVGSASGVVTLSGTVDDIKQWNAAASYASSVKGVKQIVNNVQIAESAGVTPTQAPSRTEQPGATTAPESIAPPLLPPSRRREGRFHPPLLLRM